MSADWEKVLLEAGLGLDAGHDPHVLKYGFSVGELEDLYEQTKSLDTEAHKTAVTLNQQQLNRQRHASRAHKRKKLRDEKQRIKQAIWGKE